MLPYTLMVNKAAIIGLTETFVQKHFTVKFALDKKLENRLFRAIHLLATLFGAVVGFLIGTLLAVQIALLIFIYF